MTTAEPPLTAPLASVRATDVATAGGKGASLGELVAGGFPVPDGFVVVTRAYRLAAAAAGVDPEYPAAAARRLRENPVPDVIARDVLDAYRAFGGGPVAVRSSATAEDRAEASFAGQQDTFLDVDGETSLLDALRGCWGYLWNERAVAYRAADGTTEPDLALAVIVQRMVAADAAGVLFTARSDHRAAAPCRHRRRAWPGRGGRLRARGFRPSDGRSRVRPHPRAADLTVTARCCPKPRPGPSCRSERASSATSARHRTSSSPSIAQARCGSSSRARSPPSIRCRRVFRTRTPTCVCCLSFNVVQGYFPPITPLGLEVYRLLGERVVETNRGPPVRRRDATRADRERAAGLAGPHTGRSGPRGSADPGAIAGHRRGAQRGGHPRARGRRATARTPSASHPAVPARAAGLRPDRRRRARPARAPLARADAPPPSRPDRGRRAIARGARLGCVRRGVPRPHRGAHPGRAPDRRPSRRPDRHRGGAQLRGRRTAARRPGASGRAPGGHPRPAPQPDHRDGPRRSGRSQTRSRRDRVARETLLGTTPASLAAGLPRRDTAGATPDGPRKRPRPVSAIGRSARSTSASRAGPRTRRTCWALLPIMPGSPTTPSRRMPGSRRPPWRPRRWSPSSSDASHGPRRQVLGFFLGAASGRSWARARSPKQISSRGCSHPCDRSRSRPARDWPRTEGSTWPTTSSS